MPTPTQLVTRRKVAVLIAPGLEEVEALAPVDVLFRAGIRADLVAVSPTASVTSSHGIVLTCDTTLDSLGEAGLAAYDLLFLPGGIPGTPNLAADERVVREVRRRMEAQLPLAAICAAPSILAREGLLEGRRATANPGFMDVLGEHGCLVSEEPVVRDGAVVTSRGMGTAIDLGLEMVRLLLDADGLDGEDLAEQVRQAVVYAR